MSHTLLQDPNFYHLLYRIDQDLAAEVQVKGCRCGGKLHVADYPRKPRGYPPGVSIDSARKSFCCARCRRRSTPASVRYLGRRVYFSVRVVLMSVLLEGVTAPREALLKQHLAVSRRTLTRWRQWWLNQVVQTPFWRWAKGQFLPPLDEASLPATLLARFGMDQAALLALLRFISPLSCPSSCTLYAGP